MVTSASKWKNVKLTKAGRSALRTAIREHAETPRFVQSGSAISTLTKTQLLNLAVKVGLDLDAVLSAVTDEDKLYIGDADAKTGAFAPNFFKGIVEFEIKMALLGYEVTRKARLRYTNTPEWAYFDPKLGHDVIGWEGSSEALELFVEYDSPVYKDDEINGRKAMRRVKAEWLEANDLTAHGIWTNEMAEAVQELIDRDCRRQDAANRDKAKI